MMGTAADRPAKRYPLHVTISLAFTLLLALFGFTLIGFNYLENREMALVGADDLLERIDAHMRVSVERLYAPAGNIVDVASRTLPENSDASSQGARSLGFASEVLRLAPEIASIFVGYDDGDFYQLRRVDSWPGLNEVADVPQGATFVLDSMERKGGKPTRQEWLFYDDGLRLLGQFSRPWTGFDPRERTWYAQAMSASGQIATEFYRFFTTGDVGVTVARRLDGNRGVVGADLTLRELSAGLAAQLPTPSARIAMLEPDGGVIAVSDAGQELARTGGAGDEIRMPHLSDLGDPVYDLLARRLSAGQVEGRLDLSVDGRAWFVSLSSLPTRWSDPVIVASIVPRDELLAGVVRVRDHSVLISLGLMAMTLVVVVALSRHIARSLRQLSREAEQIRELKLDTPLTVRSSIEEVDDLASTMAVMKSSLQQFLAISHALSAERRFDRLLEMVLDEARRVSNADGGAVLLRSDDDRQLDVAIVQSPSGEDQGPDHAARFQPVPLDSEPSDRKTVERTTVDEGTVIRITDASGDHGFDLRALRARFEGHGTRVHSVMCLPLLNPQGEIVGMLQLVNARGPRGELAAFRDETAHYIAALSSEAAVALDNRRLLKAQKELLESFTHLVAGAIDAKSPYTHGHCQRVPVIAKMLAQEAHASSEGVFSDFELSDDAWHALHLASWLHDCGKMTTPEYVVDKASKLETIYNRIHEVRMRFEVLLREAETDYLRASLAGEADGAELRTRFEERQAEIRGDFAFIARCNTGDESMTDEMIERVERIGAQTWERRLDDRIGLTHEELQRKGAGTEALPVTEPLLADRPEHLVPRSDGGHPFGRDDHDFRMEVPAQLYNLGEIHNLCVRRGTLTPEERFKINEHVIQTIRMLGRLPFPRELRHVPDWAGNHHEKLDGTGYPRRLGAEVLSVPERIMALADIFEALTAVDRPYMRPKMLSQAIGIMRSMCDSGHLCPDLFELFLRSGMYRRYAERYLQPQQLDEVEIERVLGSKRASA